MLDIDVPGFRRLELSHLVLDFNGTLAVDGILLPGVESRLRSLAASLSIHVVTADTFGTAGAQLSGLPCRIVRIPSVAQVAAKLDYIRALGAGTTACVGNGRNDRLMLGEAVLGIAVIQGEGAAGEATAAADVITTDITAALDLLLHPRRLIATLRA